MNDIEAAAEALLLAYERCHHLGSYIDALRSALAHAARGEGERNRRSASIEALRRIARAAKPFSFYARSLSEKPGEYVMRVPKDEADEIQRAVDALWGTDDYATPPPATGEAGTRGEVEKARERFARAAIELRHVEDALYEAHPDDDALDDYKENVTMAEVRADGAWADYLSALSRALPEAREGGRG